MLAPRELQLDIHVDHLLHDAVVQFAGQPRALLRRRAPAQRVQIAHAGHRRHEMAEEQLERTEKRGARAGARIEQQQPSVPLVAHAKVTTYIEWQGCSVARLSGIDG